MRHPNEIAAEAKVIQANLDELRAEYMRSVEYHNALKARKSASDSFVPMSRSQRNTLRCGMVPKSIYDGIEHRG